MKDRTEDKTYLKETLRKIGIKEKQRDHICSLEDPAEVIAKLRTLRCNLMDEYHCCARKIDDIDRLIRKEKENDERKQA